MIDDILEQLGVEQAELLDQLQPDERKTLLSFVQKEVRRLLQQQSPNTARNTS